MFKQCTFVFNKLALKMVCLFVVFGALFGVLQATAASTSDSDRAPAKRGRVSAIRLNELDNFGQQEQQLLNQRQADYVSRSYEIDNLLGAQKISIKSRKILERRGLGPALLKNGFPTDKAYDGVDTLKVLIVRVGFETNSLPGLTTIEPDGGFNLVRPTEPRDTLIDPAPHNRAFYESHLVGLSEYYKFQSGGRLVIEGKVLPEGQDDYYKLSDVADYGPGADNSWSVPSLEKLVRDMIVKVDEDTQASGEANLADYDDNHDFRYVIFVHAGSDWQSDVNRDSPNDIPTFFVTLGTPQSLTSVASDGSGPGLMSECSIIPETTTQDVNQAGIGYGSIAAAFYHEFGHALGLPDIYSTNGSLPTAGIWDLMDSGTNVAVAVGDYFDGELVVVEGNGVLPPSLSVWCKWFLGWVDVAEIDGQTAAYELPAVGIPKDKYPLYSSIGNFDTELPQALRTGSSPREFFLLENRWVPGQEEITPYYRVAFERDETTHVIQYLAGTLVPNPAGDDDWENTGLYDYFIPSYSNSNPMTGGLLVWHVNMDRVEQGLLNNTVNYFGDGVRLVESDGIQDIGVLDSYVAGWWGSYRDAFGDYSGNRELYVDGYPNSRFYDDSWSGLSITDVQNATLGSGAMVNFNAGIKSLLNGFPWQIASVDETEAETADRPAGPRALDPRSCLPLTFNGQSVLLVTDQPALAAGDTNSASTLYALKDDGTPMWEPLAGKPEGAVYTLDGPAAGAPVLLGTPNNAFFVAMGSRAGTVSLIRLPESGAPTLSWSRSIGSSMPWAPISLLGGAAEERLLCAEGSDTLVMLEIDGSPAGSPLVLSDALDIDLEFTAAKPRILDFNKGSVLTVVVEDKAAVFCDLGWVLVNQSSSGLAANPMFTAWPRELQGKLQSAVIPIGSDVRLVVFDAAGEIGVWTITSANDITNEDNLTEIASNLVCEPAVADLDGDGRHDLIVATTEKILAFHDDGVKVRGYPRKLYDLFPLADTTSITGPVIVADATGDGVNEIHFCTNGGHLVGLSATGKLLAETPYRWGDKMESGLAVGPSVPTDQPRLLWMVSAGGYAGPPMGRQHVNGRVHAYPFGSAANESRFTSEWLGNAGGSFRRGTSGYALSLGAAAPVSAETNSFVMYPNPLGNEDLTIRFYSHGSQNARFGLYTLEGELVTQIEIPVNAQTINEYQLSLPSIASGLYVSRLVRELASGTDIQVKTLAVEK